MFGVFALFADQNALSNLNWSNVTLEFTERMLWNKNRFAVRRVRLSKIKIKMMHITACESHIHIKNENILKYIFNPVMLL